MQVTGAAENSVAEQDTPGVSFRKQATRTKL